MLSQECYSGCDLHDFFSQLCKQQPSCLVLSGFWHLDVSDEDGGHSLLSTRHAGKIRHEFTAVNYSLLKGSPLARLKQKERYKIFTRASEPDFWSCLKLTASPSVQSKIFTCDALQVNVPAVLFLISFYMEFWWS